MEISQSIEVVINNIVSSIIEENNKKGKQYLISRITDEQVFVIFKKQDIKFKASDLIYAVAKINSEIDSINSTKDINKHNAK